MENNNNVNNDTANVNNTTVNTNPNVVQTPVVNSTPEVVVTDGSNNTKMIIATIAFVIGLGLLTFGIVNIMKGGALPKNPPQDSSTDNETGITVTEDEVRNWLDSNKVVVDYLVDYDVDFNIETATPANYSDIFAWYFAFKDGKSGTQLPEDNAYDIEYTMPREEAEIFVKNVFGKTLDVIDVNAITLSKDYFNYTSTDTEYKLQVVTTDFIANLKSEINNINILSDDVIEVTYGLMDQASTCDSSNEDCYTKYRILTLTKSEDGGLVLVSNVSENVNNDNTNTETDNNTDANTNDNTNTQNNAN